MSGSSVDPWTTLLPLDSSRFLDARAVRYSKAATCRMRICSAAADAAEKGSSRYPIQAYICCRRLVWKRRSATSNQNVVCLQGCPVLANIGTYMSFSLAGTQYLRHRSTLPPHRVPPSAACIAPNRDASQGAGSRILQTDRILILARWPARAPRQSESPAGAALVCCELSSRAACYRRVSTGNGTPRIFLSQSHTVSTLNSQGGWRMEKDRIIYPTSVGNRILRNEANPPRMTDQAHWLRPVGLTSLTPSSLFAYGDY
ncbi:hypothetical protein ASPSYDRAFT_420292 [Aspergillus sydowii CBS 593.65]|uniref:Uncharacterized protein n=1 Tax=Aspergillus sydowii CBS 593.65 TaxID=1036612 RepID=A0A1L9T897_9EURO|nr:uncharacterized protein ASPSYDRAFT_420292 [Aspergillus sydowii CBS 593.65]OJJ55652.1 hypothetical protein ASPSYDRAFT_420292 [Aspergillus sydowii CBS 593.65]